MLQQKSDPVCFPAVHHLPAVINVCSRRTFTLRRTLVTASGQSLFGARGGTDLLFLADFNLHLWAGLSLCPTGSHRSRCSGSPSFRRSVSLSSFPSLNEWSFVSPADTAEFWFCPVPQTPPAAFHKRRIVSVLDPSSGRSFGHSPPST